ncbi:sensor histidine kinase [Geobacter sulfurreducens]|uniref:sensor histidine kinase n=1 Tax=Geobacter sulfurreducens TaxID=35554 RepID=UPI000DBB3722|nr:ATP-binding protein [Geobacter sulfurreducens]BBA71545.1 Phytochrome-like protein cph1 [Geobacter sulfurreducens]
MDSPPLYNSRIFDTYLKLLAQRYPHVRTNEVLSYAGMSEHEVADPGHWFTQQQADRFHEVLARMTGNPGIAREAGRYAASPEALGLVRQYVLGLVGPALGYALLNRTAALFTRSSTFESRKIGDNRIEVTVRFSPGVRERSYQCANRTGFLEALVVIFSRCLPEIEHPECIFQGGGVCRYVISWPKGHADLWRTVRRWGLLGGAVLGLATLLLSPSLFPVVAAVTIPLVLLFFLAAERAENKDLSAAVDNLRDSTEKLLGQSQSNSDNALLVSEIGQVVSSKSDIEHILTTIAALLEKRLDYDRGVIMMADAGRSALRVLASYGFDEAGRRVIHETPIALDGIGPRGVVAGSFLDQKPFLVNDLDEIDHLIPPPHRELGRRLGIRSFISCPIVCEGQSLGVLAVDTIRTGRPLLQSDLSLLMGIAPVIGISIHNAEHLAREQRQAALLEVANQELEAFCYTVAHDLRAPLRAINGYCAVIREECGDRLPPPSPAYFSRIGAAAVRMGELIDDLLALYRVTRSELVWEEIDLSGLVGEVAEELQQRETARSVEFAIAAGVTVRGDRKLLRIALENLLGNALKYTGMRPRALIEFGTAEVDGVTACFIRDNGTGFSMRYVDKLFRPFQRLHRDDEFEGTGIGLATVHRIVNRHGGRIWAEAEEGRGAVFYIAL